MSLILDLCYANLNYKCWISDYEKMREIELVRIYKIPSGKFLDHRMFMYLKLNDLFTFCCIIITRQINLLFKMYNYCFHVKSQFYTYFKGNIQFSCVYENVL